MLPERKKMSKSVIPTKMEYEYVADHGPRISQHNDRTGFIYWLRTTCSNGISIIGLVFREALKELI